VLEGVVTFGVCSAGLIKGARGIGVIGDGGGKVGRKGHTRKWKRGPSRGRSLERTPKGRERPQRGLPSINHPQDWGEGRKEKEEDWYMGENL